MIDHFTLTVPDLARSKAFYTRALEPLGYSILMDIGEMVGFGDKLKPYFWLKAGPGGSQPMHMAFQAPSRAAVDAFHAAALGAGARDNGSPGLRSDYHPNYYAAFVVELDGHPIEAVCQLPPVRASAKKSAPKKAAAKTSLAKKSAPKKSAQKKSARKATTKWKVARKKRR